MGSEMCIRDRYSEYERLGRDRGRSAHRREVLGLGAPPVCPHVATMPAVLPDWFMPVEWLLRWCGLGYGALPSVPCRYARDADDGVHGRWRCSRVRRDANLHQLIGVSILDGQNDDRCWWRWLCRIVDSEREALMATYDFSAGQGETFDRTVTWEIDSAAVNLTGYTARLQVRKSHRTTRAVVSLTHASGLTLGGPAGTRGPSNTSCDSAATRLRPRPRSPSPLLQTA